MSKSRPCFASNSVYERNGYAVSVQLVEVLSRSPFAPTSLSGRSPFREGSGSGTTQPEAGTAHHRRTDRWLLLVWSEDYEY